ncbi:MAG: hypothetical protein JW716_03410 [Candidatus Aenigmarchaeota archaeon]|nr:hypothetical protein [Candidatus Aenigmarchaeota archaeon]
MTDILDAVTGGLNFGDPIGMAVNIILSTIVMGIVIIVLTKIIARGPDEDIAPTHAFMLALLINIINMPIFSGLIYGYIAFIPLIGIIFPLIVWILGIKLFFKDVHMMHAIIIGVIGFVLSLLVIPTIIELLAGFIPI